MKIFYLLLITIGPLLIFTQNSNAQSSENQTGGYETEIVDTLFSISLEENREFWVKLPENYDPNGIIQYPVVFLLDGFSLQNTLETVYTNYWGHYIPHMILVGISNRTNRTRDLTTSQIKMRRGSKMDAETGGSEKFTEFIEKELIPYIDTTYPALPYRTLIGHSYAGLFAINMLINHPHLFQNYIAIDPSIEWDDQKLLIQAKEKLQSESYKGKSLFIALAAEQLHMLDENITVENIMEDTSEYTLFARSIIDFSTFAASQKESGLNFSWKVYPEDLHGTVPLPAIRDGLIFLFEWFQFKSPQKYNNPDTPVEELIELLKKQEEIYTTQFGFPSPPMIEELLNGYGYMYMETGQPEKALLFFKMAIEYYPESASGYESIADYYERNSDYKNALKFLTKAYELSGKEYFNEMIQELKEKIN